MNTLRNLYVPKYQRKPTTDIAVPTVEQTQYDFEQEEFNVEFDPVLLGQLLCDYGADAGKVEELSIRFLPANNYNAALVRPNTNQLDIHPDRIWEAMHWKQLWREIGLEEHKNYARLLLLIGRIFFPRDVSITKPGPG